MELLPVVDDSTKLYYTTDAPLLFVHNHEIVNPTARSFRRTIRDFDVLTRVDELFRDRTAYDGPTVFHHSLIDRVPIIPVYYCPTCAFASKRKRDVKKHMRIKHSLSENPACADGHQIPRSYKKELNFIVKLGSLPHPSSAPKSSSPATKLDHSNIKTTPDHHILAEPSANGRVELSRANSMPSVGATQSIAETKGKCNMMKERLDSFEQTVNQELNRMEYTLSSLHSILANIDVRLKKLETRTTTDPSPECK